MKLDVLLEKPNNKVLAVIFVTTFILSILALQVFAPLMASFPEGAGLFEIKNAWNAENMNKIIEIWEKDDQGLDYWVNLMVYVHFLDGFFMVIYGTAGFTGLLLVSRLLESSEKLQKFYFNLAFIYIISPLLDVVEQINILIMLADPHNIQDINAFGASLSTLLCVLVLYSCLLIMIIGFIIALILYLKNK